MVGVLKSVDCPKETFASGKIIFEENSRGDCFYIIKEGEVEIIKGYRTPGQVLLATIHAGQVIGEISGIDGLPRTATAVARTRVTCVKVSSKTLTWQISQCPQWFQAIILDIVERLRTTDDRLIRQGLVDEHRHSSLKVPSVSEE